MKTMPIIFGKKFVPEEAMPCKKLNCYFWKIVTMRIFVSSAWWKAVTDQFECKSFDAACEQCGHPHSHQQVPFACVARARPVWMRPQPCPQLLHMRDLLKTLRSALRIQAIAEGLNAPHPKNLHWTVLARLRYFLTLTLFTICPGLFQK